jgi:hypothetical protein
MIGQDYSPNAVNVRFRFGEVRPTPGRSLFDGDVAGQKALAITNFSMSNGTIWPLLLTDNKLFRLGNLSPGDSRNWTKINGTFTPTIFHRWGFCVGEDKFFFSNSADEIAYWDGDTTHPFDMISSVAGFEGTGANPAHAPTARFLEYFNGRVLLGNVTEGGTILANRLRWPYNGDFRKWNETQQLGAGFMDLNEEGAEAIRGVKALDDRCIVYKRNSIGDLTPTGTLSPTFIHQVRFRGVGVGAPGTLASSGTAHFFLADDQNVWMWDGNKPTPIGEPIHEELKSLSYRSTFNQYFGFCSLSRYEYWLILCDSDRGSFDVFIYDYFRNYWTRDVFPNIYTIGEIEVPLFEYTWNTIPGVWTDWNIPWADLFAATTTEVIAGRTDSVTMDINETISWDYFSQGSIVDRVLETEDMYIDTPWDNAQSVRLLLNYEYASKEPFEVGVSFDRGKTWTTKQITPTTQGYSFVEFTKSGNVVRYRFRENNATGFFRWRSYMCEYLPIGDFLGTVTA